MDALFNPRAFRQVAQSGSFTRAAEQFDISTVMTSKHVGHLENSIKAKLLRRNSRNLHPTEAGEEYYRQCSYALDAFGTAAQKATGGVDMPQDMLRVTMPLWFAGNLINNWLVEYRERYPEVTLDLVLDNRHADLIVESFDLTLRVAKTLSPPSIVKPLARIQFILLASPDYLVKHGALQTPKKAMHHPAILPSYTDQRSMEITHRETDERNILTLGPVIQCDNTLMIRELVRTGAGIAYQPLWLVGQDLVEGRLARLLPDCWVLTVQLNVVYMDRAFLSAKVRSFIDFLNEKISVEQD